MSLLLLKPLEIQNLKRKNWRDMAYYVPTVWKSGGTRPPCFPPNCTYAYVLLFWQASRTTPKITGKRFYRIKRPVSGTPRDPLLLIHPNHASATNIVIAASTSLHTIFLCALTVDITRKARIVIDVTVATSKTRQKVSMIQKFAKVWNAVLLARCFLFFLHTLLTDDQ